MILAQIQMDGAWVMTRMGPPNPETRLLTASIDGQWSPSNIFFFRKRFPIWRSKISGSVLRPPWLKLLLLLARLKLLSAFERTEQVIITGSYLLTMVTIGSAGGN